MKRRWWGGRALSAERAFPAASGYGMEGGDKAVKVPSCITIITKKHVVSVKLALTYLAVCVICRAMVTVG